MGKLRNALVLAMLGLIFVWGITLAQDRPQGVDSGKPNKPPREGMGNMPEGQRPGGPDGMMDNPKVQEEMKRHQEVMKGFVEQIKALHEKMRKETEAKMKDWKTKLDNPNKPDDSNSQNNPNNPEKPKPVDGGKMPPPPERPKSKEEMLKLLEPYRPEAQKIADSITAELVTHHQNLFNIVTGEQENIKNALTDKILLPPPPRFRQGRPGMGQRPERGLNRPNRPDNTEPPNNQNPPPPDNPDDFD